MKNCMDGIKDVIEKPMKLSDDELLKLNIENKIKEANDLKNKNCKDTKELHKRIDKKLEVLKSKRRRLDIKKKN